MKQANFTRPPQQGFSLIEAMVSIVLVAILGLGLTYATSRVLLTQRYATTQSLAVIQMREYLQTGENQKVSVAGVTVPIDPSAPSSVNVTIGVSGKAGTEKPTTIPSRSLTVTSTELFSGDGTISLSY